MAISVQQQVQFAVYGDGNSSVATFNLSSAPFTGGSENGVEALGISLAVGTPSSVAPVGPVLNGFAPTNITFTTSLLLSALTLNFSSPIPNDGNPYTVQVTFTYNG